MIHLFIDKIIVLSHTIIVMNVFTENLQNGNLWVTIPPLILTSILTFIVVVQTVRLTRLKKGVSGDVNKVTVNASSAYKVHNEFDEVYSVLLNDTSDFIYVKNSAGQFTECNQAFCGLLGLSKNQIIGNSGELLDKAQLAILNRLDIETYEEEKTRSTEFTFERKSKISTFDYQSTCLNLAFGDKYLITRLKDVTELRRSKEKLRILAAAIEHGMAAVAVSDASGKLEYVNQGFLKTTGYKKYEILGENPRVLKSGYHNQQYYNHIWNTIRKGEEWAGEFCNRAKNGNFYWELANIIPVKNEEGVVTHFVKVSQNITEQKYIEGKITDSEEKFKSFVKKSTDGIVITDEFGKVRVWNPALESLSGISRRNALGRSIWDIQYQFLPEDRKSDEVKVRLQNSLETILTNGESSFPSEPFTQNFIRNGVEVFFQTIVFPIKTKKGHCIGSISRDITNEVKSRKQLEQSRHYYQQIFNSIQDLIYVSDKDGNITFANQSFLSFFQLKNDALKNKLNEGFIRKKIVAIPENKDYKNELLFRGSDGESYTFLTKSSDIKDLDNNVLSHVNVGRDISAIRKVERFNALQLELNIELGKVSDRDEAYRILAKYLVRLKEIDVCVIYIKNRFIDQYELKATEGISAGKIDNHNLFDLTGEFKSVIESREIIHTHFNELQKYFQPESFADMDLQGVVLFPLETNDEVTATINFASRRYPSFSIGLMKKVRLLTNQLSNHLLRIEIEEQRKVHTNDLKNIFNSNTDFIFISDESGKVVEMNPSVQAKLDYSLEELKGKPVINLHPENQRKHALQIFKKNVIDKKLNHFDFDIDLEAKDGTVIHTNTSVVGGTWDGKKVWIGISRDLSNKLVFQRELKAAKEKAEAANKAKSQFLASISHEIKTPINSIKGFSSLLKRNITGDKVNLAYVEAIESGTKSLTTLINDILDYAKIERGKITIQESIININKFLNSINQDYRIILENKWELDFIFERSEKLPALINIDEVRLRQIISNLLNNAIKFTDKGFVKFGFSVSNVKPDKVDLLITVEDTGIGIQPDMHELIFEPFEQQDTHDNKKYSGSGLGLAITKELVELMNGSISVESEMGKGTCFTVSIPNVSVPEHFKNQTDSATATVYPESSALIIKNKYNLHDSIFDTLRKYRVNVYEVTSNRNAIKLAKRTSPDVIFLSTDKKGLNFKKTIEILKNEPLTKHIPVVLVDLFHSDIQPSQVNADDILYPDSEVHRLNEVVTKYTGLKKQKDAVSPGTKSGKLNGNWKEAVTDEQLKSLNKAYESPFMKQKENFVRSWQYQLEKAGIKNDKLMFVLEQLSNSIASYDIETVNTILKNLIETSENERLES